MVKTPRKKALSKKRVSVSPAITEDHITPGLDSLRYALYDCQQSNEGLAGVVEILSDDMAKLSEAIGELEAVIEKKAEEKNTK